VLWRGDTVLVSEQRCGGADRFLVSGSVVAGTATVLAGVLHLHGPPLHSWRSNSSNFGEGTDLFYIL
jgi:hypothetical protein